MLLGVTQKMGFEVEEEVILVNLSEIMEMMKGITEGKRIAKVFGDVNLVMRQRGSPFLELSSVNKNQ